MERYEFVEFHERKLPPPRFNIAPSQSIVVVIAAERGKDLVSMRWGYRPAWMQHAKQPPPINARAETLAESKLFKAALSRKRCVVPADGFYEWQTLPGGRKRPVHVEMRDGGLMAFAGLFTEPTTDAEATCAIVTLSANELLEAIHPRMPAILSLEDEAVWLDPSVTDPTALLGCLRPYPAEEMAAYPVSDRVSSVRNDGPELIEPVAQTPGGAPGQIPLL